MFIGEYQHSLDNKARFIVPVKIREQLGDKAVITKGFDKCLFIYTLEEWHNIEKKLAILPFMDKKVRAFSRMFFSGAAEVEVDKQGRVLLPNNLREYAEIIKDVVIMGVSNRIEVWGKESLAEYMSGIDDSYEDLAEEMLYFDNATKGGRD